MSQSPTKESTPSWVPRPASTLNPPPSPHSHRSLRRLQSAHTLGQASAHSHTHTSSNSNLPSLISQQHKAQSQQQQQSQPQPQQHHHQRPHSPVRSSTRQRANSDVSVTMNPSVPTPPMAITRRSNPPKKRPSTDLLSLERLIRDGPPEGDVQAGLDRARLKILDQGIKSDSDGMVR